MKINSIQNNYQIPRGKTVNQPTFQRWQREVFASRKHRFFVEHVINRNDTWFFRPCPSWKELAVLLGDKFFRTPKVNIYNYGCSNGSEAYTFIMQMLSEYEWSFARRFFPVIAKDIDEVAIEKAKEKGIRIDQDEIDSINLHTLNGFNNFFEEEYTEDNEGKHIYVPKPVLKDNVQFSQENILRDIQNIKPDNSVVFVRNFWPYLEPDERIDLACKLYRQLGKNSFIVFGDFDVRGTEFDIPIEKLLRNVGFKETDLRFVMEKVEKTGPEKPLWQLFGH